MIGRDQLITRSLGVLTGMVAVWLVAGLALPIGVRHEEVSGYLGLLGLAWAAARSGRARLGAGLVLALGVPALGVEQLRTGGPTSLLTCSFPLAAMAAWSWLGRGWGLATIAVLSAFLVAGDWLNPEPTVTPVADTVAAYISAAVIGVAFLRAVTRELRRASETAWRRAAESERAAREAVEANEARDRFLAAVSHELRTPLDTVLGYAELVRETETDPDRAEDVDRIHAAGEQLLALVNDILDIAPSAATHDATIQYPPFEVLPLVDEVVATTAPLAAARRDRVTVHAASELPPMRSDRRRIRQILLNLVSNAVKYTADGEIVIEVERAADGLVWRVRDSGVGIPPDRLHLLFQPFVQLHQGTERRPGMGLGLALSQRLAERLGGRIEAESEHGRGSTFTLRLPVAHPASAGRTTGLAQTRSHPIERIHVRGSSGTSPTPAP